MTLPEQIIELVEEMLVTQSGMDIAGAQQAAAIDAEMIELWARLRAMLYRRTDDFNPAID